MRRYAHILGDLSPTARGATRIGQALAVLEPPPEATGQASNNAYARRKAASEGGIIPTLQSIAPHVVGAAGGAYLWKTHPILGAAVGHALTTAAWETYQGDSHKAICMLAVEGAGVAGALLRPSSPLVGYIGGAAAGAAVTYFVPDSPVRKLVSRLTR